MTEKENDLGMGHHRPGKQPDSASASLTQKWFSGINLPSSGRLCVAH